MMPLAVETLSRNGSSRFLAEAEANQTIRIRFLTLEIDLKKIISCDYVHSDLREYTYWPAYAKENEPVHQLNRPENVIDT
jgi:hypothetical protein